MSQPGPAPGDSHPCDMPSSRVPYGAEQPTLIETNSDARLWGMLCHITTLSAGVGIPGFVGPLVIWLMKKDELPFVDDQGKESLNFQIMLILAYVVSVVMVYFCIGIFMLMAVGVFHLVFVIIATIKANEGVYYRYPINLRLIT